VPALPSNTISRVDNERFGCGSKITHNITGLFGVMEGADSDLRTGLPWQMVEIHEPMRLLVVVEQTPAVLTAILNRQPPLQELINNGWIILASKNPSTAWSQPSSNTARAAAGWPGPARPYCRRWRDPPTGLPASATPCRQRCYSELPHDEPARPPRRLGLAGASAAALHAHFYR
jgi:hypothetical protein